VDADVQQLALDAAERLEVAGRRQMLRSDLGGAIDLLERATTLRARDVLDVALELGLAGAYMMCGRPADAVSRAAAAAAAARHAGDRVGELQADLARLGFTVHVPGSGNWAPLMQAAIDEAMPVFEAADDPSALAWGWWSVTQVAHNLCRFGDAYDAASKCRDYAERSGDHFLVSQAGHISGPIAMGPKPIPEALQELTQMAAAGSHDVWIDQFIAELTGLLGRTDEAWELYRASIAAFHERGMTMAAAIAAQGGWYIAMADGDAATAIDLLRESCRQLEQMGESAFASTNAAQLADALYVTGDYEEAGQWVERALELADDSDYATQTQARGVRALLAARAGDVAAADADVDAALRMSMTMQSPQTQGALALNVAEVYRLLGRPDERREQLRQALAYFTAKESVVYAGRAAAALADA
jgi:tetratricopeptide (TPR) repeat protein